MKLEEPIPGEAIQGGQAKKNIHYWYSGTATHKVRAGEEMHDVILSHGMSPAPHTTNISAHDRYFVIRNESGSKGILYATPLCGNWRTKTDGPAGFEEHSIVLKESRSRKIAPPQIIVPSGPNGVVNRRLRTGRAACASGCC